MRTSIKNLSIYFLLLLVTSFTNSLTAQSEIKRCGTSEKMEKNMKNPDFANNYKALKAKVSNKIRGSKIQAPCVNPLIVPVVIHFQPSSISDQCMINASLAQIEQTNADFSGCNTNADMLCNWITAGCTNFGGSVGADAMPDDGACIQFCLADQNLPADGNLIPGGLAITTGYNATSQNAPSLWNGYLNIYVGDLGGDLGFVNFLSGGASTNTTQGTSVLTSAFGAQFFNGCEGVGNDANVGDGATLTHEIGHWLGLEHTFEDNLTDTPPQSQPNFGCPSVNTNTCTSSVGSDYSGNFMDYVDDDCMFTFTQDQVDIMLATTAPQNAWATNSISCITTYPPCGATNQAGACIEACPTTVITSINLNEDACGQTTLTAFPNPLNNGLVVDEVTDLVLTWSVNNYLSVGGTTVLSPTIQTSNNCNIVSKTYYLNIDCASTPLNTTLNGGTLVVSAYPNPPTDMTTLIQVSNENTCSEPIITPIAGCSTYINIIANAGNPSFPVNTNNSGAASYNVTFVSNPAGPNCCANSNNTVIIDASTNDGDLEILGSGGSSPWVPTSTNFGTVMCNSNTCGSANGSINYGVAPNSGNWLAWFGGVDSFEQGTLRGTFPFSSCTNGQTNLSFAFENSSCGSVDDFIQLRVDGNLEWNYNTNASNCDSPGTIQTITVDLSAYADGNNHTLLFRSISGNSGTTNFTVDNINLISTGCNVNACNYTISANYNCSNNCVTMLNLSNRHNTTALYQASINIQSTAEVNANVDYKAGTRITLNSGFKTNTPNRFTAYIEDCN